MPLAALSLALLALAAGVWLACDRVAGEPIRIAFAGPTSGASAEDGLSAVRAIELVLDEVNAAGGVNGRSLQLDVYDDANDPARARANASRIADEAHTLAVIGHNFSTSSIAAGEVYAARGIPAVSTAATSVAVTRDNPWYFRVVYNDRTQGRFVVAYVRHVLEAERFGVVHESDAYGSFLAEVMEATAPLTGLTLAGAWSFDPSDPRLDDRLGAIAREVSGDTPPEALVLAMQPEAGVKLVKRLRDLGFPGELVVTDALASQAFADGFSVYPEERSRPGFYTDGIHASTPFLFDVGGRQAARFVRDYVARYDRAPDWYAAFAADAVGVLVEAMRRAEPSGEGPAPLPDRASLRDALAGIGPLEAVQGITGPTWFDEVGDAEKPVPMGRFQNGEIVSGQTVLRLVPDSSRSEESDDGPDASRIVPLGDQVLYRTDVAKVGVRARRFGELDFDQGTFEMEFDLWFRHGGDPEIERIRFTNAVEPVVLGEPVEEVLGDGLHYRRYYGKGRFRADMLPARYGGHVLSLSFQHDERTRDDLVLAIDPVGMNLGRASTRAQRGNRARQLLGASTDWTVEDVFFFEEEVDEPALGHPGYLRSARHARTFSRLTIGITLRRDGASLAALIPPGQRAPLLGLGLVGSALLLFLGRRRAPRLRFFLQAAAVLLVLVTAEPVLGSWLAGWTSPADLERFARAFDVLWWLVPAFLVTVAIQRFLWTPAEGRTGNPVPTILRWFVSFVVYVFAVFGIVAFVYDYRLTGLLATSGVLAMIIGLAVQLNITNIFAGVALNLERPFRVGDWIMVHGRTPDPDQGVIGMVVDINWRTTRLRTADDTEIVIPNGIISEKTITNFMHPGEQSRFELRFSVDQSVSPEKVVPLIQRAAESVIGAERGGPLADPPPKVRISKVTEQGVEYVLRYRIVPSQVSPLKARHTLNSSVLEHLHEAGIELAYPKRIVEERSRESGA
jgi:branched-chain amino acid transport system substrate-binding protein